MPVHHATCSVTAAYVPCWVPFACLDWEHVTWHLVVSASLSTLLLYLKLTVCSSMHLRSQNSVEMEIIYWFIIFHFCPQLERFDDFTIASSWERYSKSAIMLTVMLSKFLILMFGQAYYVQRFINSFLNIQVYIWDRGYLPSMACRWREDLNGRTLCGGPDIHSCVIINWSVS